jgi:hypothetical protein
MSNSCENKDLKILKGLIELSQWEWTNIPVINSVIGRHVYLSLASELLSKSDDSGPRSLKQVLNHPGHTDRAIRIKLLEMERMGLVTRAYSEGDKRVRPVVPTAAFAELLEKHAKFYRSLLEKDFILLEK